MQKKIPKVTISLLVYNGEKFLQKRIESFLNQTFQDFELIISDNCSEDNTQSICEKYAQKDERIQYVRQKQNIGMFANHIFVSLAAKGELLALAAHDDIWTDDYLEKHVKMLENNKSFIGSMNRIKNYGPYGNQFQIKSKDSKFMVFYKKLRRYFRSHDFTNSIIGETYEERARAFLRGSSIRPIFGVYRTREYQKVMNELSFVSNWDYVIVFKLLRYGNIGLIDEILLQYYTGSSGAQGIIKYYKTGIIKFHSIFFPNLDLTKFCAKSFGIKFFIKNLDYFLFLNLSGFLPVILSITRSIKSKIMD